MSVFLSSRLRPLRFGSREAHLSFIPQTLTTVEVIQIVFVFIVRQVLHLVGLGNNVFIASKDGKDATLPDFRLSMPFHITKSGLREYAKAVGNEDTTGILKDAAQACLLLSAFSEPAMLLLLASRDCPILPLGAVNVRNRFELLAPRLCMEDALLNLKNAELRARIVTKPRRAKRGLEVDLEVEIVNLAEDVVIFRQVFTMLQFMRFKPSDSTPVSGTARPDANFDWDAAPAISCRMAQNAPLAWARICMDYNVLHTSTLAARLFGFPGRIAHGNHAVALGIARLHDNGEYSDFSLHGQREFMVMEVYFLRPMTLPATLLCQSRLDRANTGFRISQGGKGCVVASIQVFQQNHGEESH